MSKAYLNSKTQLTSANKSRQYFLNQGLFLLGLSLWLLIPCDAAFGQLGQFHTFKSDRLGVSMDYPVSFMRIPELERGAIIFAAKSSKADFPRVTLAARSGSYPARSERDHQLDILGQYQRIGLSDTRILGTRTSKFTYMNKARHAVRLNYTTRGEKRMDEVVYISGQGTHFVATFTDLPLDYPAHTALREKVLASITLSPKHLSTSSNNAASNTQKTSRVNTSSSAPSNRPQLASSLPIPLGSTQSSNKPPVFGALMLVAALIVGAATLFRQDTATKTNQRQDKAGNG